MKWRKGIEGQRMADLGDGTFLNPIMSGDHPDPSILKDGEVVANPSPATILDEGDLLGLIGAADELAAVDELLAGSR